jgi:hypothetical protein
MNLSLSGHHNRGTGSRGGRSIRRGSAVVFPQRYEIRVQGTLPASLRTAFVPLTSSVEAAGTVTVLNGVIGDQAELTGILQTLDSLGLILLEVAPDRAVTLEG